MNAPKMMFGDESVELISEGCDLMAGMVRGSVEQGQLPPPDIWLWFVKHTTVRFIAYEYALVYAPELGLDAGSDVQLLADEVATLMRLAAANKQFSISEQINSMLRTRLLHLPEAYQQTLGKNLLPP